MFLKWVPTGLVHPTRLTCRLRPQETAPRSHRPERHVVHEGVVILQAVDHLPGVGAKPQPVLARVPKRSDKIRVSFFSMLACRALCKTWCCQEATKARQLEK